LIYQAPAKLNLFLHVVGQRPDGYHRLQSVMVLIDLYDTLTFEVTRSRDVILETPTPGVDAPSDLTVRAALLLQQVYGVRFGARIWLKKAIPMGAGLGGGSSDAATTLMALQSLWNLHIPRQDLIALALKLGADVPFFIGGEAAWVEGIGEELTPITLPELGFLLHYPDVHVATPPIFRDPHLTRDHKTVKMSDFSEAMQSGGWYIDSSMFGNDLEPVVHRLFPQVKQSQDSLMSIGLARMTGSGCCLFIPFQQFAQAHGALQSVAEIGIKTQSWACRSLIRHPHANLLAVA
jgi:4-diphosphocytidyl-2-C-methyl-D-erythritol kinase